ncbi:hypothetical protein Moror_1136 [Moniliophthora roreri MCA 2997]|uniref:Uncharacterized protein n=1 Tax=Moniliophthora roreri (strain MCA 2997) TaxID=1381753 RepID=V2WXS2_MONRO|nr:hypothetical protein Moror_1136 [Moniliophthora roreri MCA 2997]
MSFYTNPSVQTGLPPFNPSTQVLPDNVVHTEPFHPSTFKLLYLLNSEHYDEEMTTAIDASSKRNRALYGCLLFLRELRNETILAAHQLLTLIGEMIPHGTTPTMGMENSERLQDLPLGNGIVVDMGSPEGPRIFRRIDQETEMRERTEPQWQEDWLIGGQPIASNM